MKVCRLCRRYASGAMEKCSFDGGELIEAPLPPFAPGDSFGHYTVKRALAAGQSGVLLLCEKEEEEEQGEHIVKVLNPSVQSVKERHDELKKIAQLDIPGIHPIEKVFDEDGRMCVVQPLLEGETLAVRIKKSEPLSVEETIKIGRKLCKLFEQLHNDGIFHNDLRPGHLFIPDEGGIDDIVVLDLGSPSPPGSLSAPDRHDGHTDEAEIDVYGICMTLYVALSGRSPFRADTPDELAWQVHHSPPPPLKVVRKIGPVNLALERLILLGLSKTPKERPLLRQVSQILKGIAIDDHELVERKLKQAQARKDKAQASAAGSSSAPTLRMSTPFAEQNPTLKIVQKFLPKSILKSTGLTQAFYAEGEELEREIALAEIEETQARRENLMAWIRLLILLTVALVLGGLTVYFLLQQP